MSDAIDAPPAGAVPGKLLRGLLLLLRPPLARKLCTLVADGYLAQTGWVRSVLSGSVVGADGEPVPWASQSFIDFMTPRLRPDWILFEYGSGASTLFYAKRVARVTSVEHDAGFAAGLGPKLPLNAQLLVRPVGSEDYVEAVAQCPPRPQLVIVDGRDRVRCVEAALRHVSTDGVIVLDDSERPAYAPALTALREAGFRSVEFWGLAPGWVRQKCTTVFYRDGNILGL